MKGSSVDPFSACAVLGPVLFLFYVLGLDPLMILFGLAVGFATVLLMRFRLGWWLAFLFFCFFASAWLWNLILLLAARWVTSLPKTHPVDLLAAIWGMAFNLILIAAMIAGKPQRLTVQKRGKA